MNTEEHTTNLADGWETKFCTSHQGKAVETGGVWLISNGGKNKRWICAACREFRNTRKEMNNA